MRTKHIAYFVLIAAVVLMFTGCDALFQNTFQQLNLAQPSATALAEQAASSDPQVAQTAQATIIEQKLKENGAAAIVNTIDVGKLTSLSGSSDTSALIDAVIPASLQDDPAALATAIDGLASMTGDVDALAQKISDASGTTYVDAGSELQTALLVKVVANLSSADPTQTTGEAVADYITALKTDASADPTTYFSAPNLSALDSDASLTTLLTAVNGAPITLEDYFKSFAGS